MPKFRLNRRAVLRGAGSVAIALPWLEVMGTEKSAHAAAAPALRFLGIYQPGGSVINDTKGVNKWRPTGTETAPILSPILAPLEPIKSKVLVVDGLSMKSAVGEQHQAGILAWMSGTPQNGPPNVGYAKGPSIDQVIADKLSAGGKKKIPSLLIAVRWATGKSKGNLSPINAANFEFKAPYSPIPPRIDPQKIFTDVFGTLDPTMSPDTTAKLDRKKSVLDFLDKRYAGLSGRVSGTDRIKIDQHLEKIRELETSLQKGGVTTLTCKAPAKVDTTGYRPDTGVNSTDTGSVLDIATDTLIPKVGKFMMDMMVMAFACDLTNSGMLQWTDTEAKHTFPWLNLSEHHHFYQHDGGFKPIECEKIATWYTEQHAYLLQEMNKVDMGGHTLLDESVVFVGSEIGDPPSHKKDDMPFLLAGGGGGLRGGRWIRNSGVSHNNLLVSILNLFGDTRTTFGDPKYCTGALPNIT